MHGQIQSMYLYSYMYHLKNSNSKKFDMGAWHDISIPQMFMSCRVSAKTDLVLWKCRIFWLLAYSIQTKWESLARAGRVSLVLYKAPNTSDKISWEVVCLFGWYRLQSFQFRGWHHQNYLEAAGNSFQDNYPFGTFLRNEVWELYLQPWKKEFQVKFL